MVPKYRQLYHLIIQIKICCNHKIRAKCLRYFITLPHVGMHGQFVSCPVCRSVCPPVGHILLSPPLPTCYTSEKGWCAMLPFLKTWEFNSTYYVQNLPSYPQRSIQHQPNQVKVRTSLWHQLQSSRSFKLFESAMEDICWMLMHTKHVWCVSASLSITYHPVRLFVYHSHDKYLGENMLT